MPASGSFEHVKQETKASEAWLLDRHGQKLHRMRVNAQVRRGEWIALADMSPALREAMVLSEDKRFYEHSGVDWKAVSAAAWGNLLNQRTRGASTLSMQLASLIDEGPRTGSERKNIFGKAGQAISATSLERSWRKDQILEAYLNLVPFRGEIQGIDALSRTLFDKAAHGLDAREAAIAAALVRAPNAKAQTVASRACGVLRSMQPTNDADCAALAALTQAVLPRKAWEASDGIAPHAARRLLAKAKVDQRSTLDAALQRQALQSLQQHLRELRGRNVQDGAVVVLDNASGQVLAYVGSSGELGTAQEVDAAAALRQAGSTLKPFLYAQAIQEQRITAASLLEDSSAHIPTASGLYIPQNYDRSFKGWVSTRTALGASLNVPAVRTLVMVSPDAFAKQLRKLGLPLKNEGDFYGYSLALGSADVSLLSLTNAYRALANGGQYSESSFVKTAAAPAQTVINPQAAFIVSDIMSDGNARARTFGTDNVLATRFWSAVKTGTSKDMRDNWAVGYSQKYTVGVWVGNASGASMWDVSGVSGAAPVWASIMSYLHERTPSRAPQPPAGLVREGVNFSAQGAQMLEAPRQEWFVSGTQQVQFARESTNTPKSIALRAASITVNSQKSLKNTEKNQIAQITSPAAGTIIALDPDIPPRHQRLHFKAKGDAAQWLLNGKSLGDANHKQWLPMPGRHTLQLADAQGRVLDEVKFEVRGAAMKMAVVKSASAVVK
ncbi:penicillin-binding protein 1C [Variovorax sp. PCZ-1]|uniref:penicillin-binding protein 1C n=1 Tax=Variovorax sp. PCZ-1 TaxID=2835533 RepID=UPI0020C052BF|nr:penicillin-binding protein 1C [Variovorax sp. PCZ-1]